MYVSLDPYTGTRELAERDPVGGGEYDRRAREEIGAILDCEPQRTAGHRDDQVELDVAILLLEQRPELRPRLVALEQGQVEVLGVEVDGSRQPRGQGGSKRFIDDD